MVALPTYIPKRVGYSLNGAIPILRPRVAFIFSVAGLRKKVVDVLALLPLHGWCWHRPFMFMFKNAILDGCSTVDSTLDFDDIGWYCMVFDSILLLNSIHWYSMVLHGLRWYCRLLHGIWWYSIIFDSPRFPLDIPKIPPRFPQDFSKIPTRFPQDSS